MQGTISIKLNFHDLEIEGEPTKSKVLDAIFPDGFDGEITNYNFTKLEIMKEEEEI